MDPVLLSRLHFAFTVIYHYLFPPFTMGMALLIVILKSLAIWRKNEVANEGVRFWSRIFAVNFIVGVVTGIPMEFQFGTNWAQFSTYAGNIIAQTLAMEGAFAFFLESAFVGLLLFGERRFGQTVHWFAARRELQRFLSAVDGGAVAVDAAGYGGRASFARQQRLVHRLGRAVLCQ